MNIKIDKDVFESCLSIIRDEMDNIFMDRYNKSQKRIINSALITLEKMSEVEI